MINISHSMSLAQKIAQKAKAAILIGQTAGAIGKIIQNTSSQKQEHRSNSPYAKTLEEAVKLANGLAVEGGCGFT